MAEVATLFSIQQLLAIILLIVPGYCITKIARRIARVEMRNHEVLIESFMFSLPLYLVAFWDDPTNPDLVSEPLRWFLIMAVLVVLIGVVWGIVLRKRVFERICQALGLPLVEPWYAPDIFSHLFSTKDSSYNVMVELKDGRRFEGALLLTDDKSRALLLTNVYLLNENFKRVKHLGSSQLLIKESEIKYILLNSQEETTKKEQRQEYMPYPGPYGRGLPHARPYHKEPEFTPELLTDTDTVPKLR
jgi:small nuclear ribonucleoprotein (snRNP)-like protein